LENLDSNSDHEGGKTSKASEQRQHVERKWNDENVNSEWGAISKKNFKVKEKKYYKKSVHVVG